MVGSDGESGAVRTPRMVQRRDLLATGVSGLAAFCAGCSIGSSGQQAPRPSGESRNDTSETSDQILLPSLDVGGSPGGLVALQPEKKVALLDFFATWCAPCKPEMDHLRAVREQYETERVALVSITQERDEAAVTDFWHTNDGIWPVVLDPSARAARHYGATSIPTILVLTPDGTVVRRFTGLVREPRLVDALDTALASADTG